MVTRVALSGIFWWSPWLYATIFEFVCLVSLVCHVECDKLQKATVRVAVRAASWAGTKRFVWVSHPDLPLWACSGFRYYQNWSVSNLMLFCHCILKECLRETIIPACTFQSDTASRQDFKCGNASRAQDAWNTNPCWRSYDTRALAWLRGRCAVLLYTRGSPWSQITNRRETEDREVVTIRPMLQPVTTHYRAILK